MKLNRWLLLSVASLCVHSSALAEATEEFVLRFKPTARSVRYHQLSTSTMTTTTPGGPAKEVDRTDREMTQSVTVDGGQLKVKIRRVKWLTELEGAKLQVDQPEDWSEFTARPTGESVNAAGQIGEGLGLLFQANPVQVGSEWSVTVPANNLTPVAVTNRYRVLGVDQIMGRRCLMIEVHGDGAGPVAGREGFKAVYGEDAKVAFDPQAGIIVEAESTSISRVIYPTPNTAQIAFTSNLVSLRTMLAPSED